MRGLVLSLALLCFTGAQARYPWQRDEPQSSVQQLRAAVEGYLNKAQDIGKEAIKQIDTSEYVKQYDLKLAEKFEALSTGALNLRSQAHPFLLQLREQVVKELETDIPLLKEKVRPILENFRTKWVEDVAAYQQNVGPLFTEWQQKAKENIQVLREKLLPLAESVRDKLRTDIDNLRSTIAPYSDDIKQKIIEKLEDYKANAGPRAEKYRAQVDEFIKNLRERLEPVGEIIKQQLLPHAEEAKAKLAKLAEVLKNRNSQAA
ncbi:uncharacterized protein RCH25_007571 [Pelodytes ibericus]